DPVADHALLGQRLAEGGARVRPGAYQLDGPLREADRAHAVVDPARAEPRLRDREPAALVADQVGRGHPDVAEHNLGVAAVLVVVVAEDLHAADDRHAGGVARHQDHRLLAVTAGGRVGLAHHDEDLRLRVQRPGDPPLVAVDDVLVAVAHDAGGDVGGVRGRHLGLGHRERGADLAVEQRPQPALLLLGGAELDEHLHVAGVRGRAVQRGGRQQQAAAGDLRERRVLQVGQPGAVLARQEQVPQPARPRLGAQFTQHRRLGPGPAVVERGELLAERGLGRVDRALHEVEQRGSQFLGSRVEAEVHYLSSWIAASPEATRGSTIVPISWNPSPTVWPWTYLKWMPSRITAALNEASAM